MCNFLFIAFGLSQLCETGLVPRLRCSFVVLVPGLPVMLILWLGCSPRSLQTGPGRRPGRTGPHIQPRDGLRPAQHQRDACRRWPGYMRATLSTRSSSLSSAPTPPPHPPHPLPLHPTLSASSPSQRCRERGMRWGRGRGQGSTHSFSSPSSQNSQSVPRPLFSAPPPFPLFLLHLAMTPEGTIFFLHCYI